MTVGLWLRVAGGLAVSVIACVLLVSTVDLGGVAASLHSVDPRWFGLTGLALAGQFGLRSMRAAMLLSATTDSRISTRRIAPPLAVGYLANAVLPARLGEVVRTVFVARRERIPITQAAAATVVERVVDLAALIAVGALLVGLSSANVAAGVAGVAVACVAPFLPVVAARWIASRSLRWLPAAAQRVASAFIGGMAKVSMRLVVTVFGLSLVAWAGDAIVLWSAAQSIGASVPVLSASMIAVGAVLGTTVPAAGGYLGTYELGAVAGGSIFGLPAQTVIPIAVVAHVAAVVPIAIVGLLVILRTGLGDLRYAVRSATADPGTGVQRATVDPPSVMR